MSTVEEFELQKENHIAEDCEKDIEAFGSNNQRAVEHAKENKSKFNNILSSVNIRNILKKIKTAPLWIKWSFLVICITSYFFYFVAVLLIHSKRDEENYWCDGDGFLIVITTLSCLGIFYFQVVKKFFFSPIMKSSAFKTLKTFCKKEKTKYFFYFSVILGFTIFIAVDARNDTGRLTSAIGIVVLVIISCLMSAAPTQIKFHQIFWGIGLQFSFGLLILRTSIGRGTFKCLGDKFTTFLDFTSVGSSFAFGRLGTDKSIYVFSILTVILFFGMVVSILYYYGILQWIIIKLGYMLEMLMGTTPCESMAASANVFLGTSEAPLVILPYIKKLTKSELHAVMTGGYATSAGGVLSAYVAFGISASHLMSASFMSAPAALAISKIIYPETQHSKTNVDNIVVYKGEEKSVLHAIITGLHTSLVLIGSITASMVAFMGFVAFLNSSMDWFCQLLDYENGTCELQGFLGILLSPVACLMGVPLDDCKTVGYLLGTRIIINEFYAYKELGRFYNAGMISERAVVISTYALCGFASVGNLGSTLASLGSMAPSRRSDIAKILISALFAGNMACYLTAAVAGTLSTDSRTKAINFNTTMFT